jgi:hypothetical protein
MAVWEIKGGKAEMVSEATMPPDHYLIVEKAPNPDYVRDCTIYYQSGEPSETHGVKSSLGRVTLSGETNEAISVELCK